MQKKHLWDWRKGLVALLAVLVALLAGGLNQAKAAEWSGWNTFNNWEGFDFRTMREKDPGADGKYTWHVEVRNRYQKHAYMDIKVTRRDETPEKFSDRLDIRSGGTSKTWFRLAEASNVRVWEQRVRFGDDSGPIATPDKK